MGRYSAIGMNTYTINPREMAISKWRQDRDSHTVALVIKPDDLEEFKKSYPNGTAWILKTRLAAFFAEQQKKESNGQTVVRLMREGRWRSFTHG